MPFGITAIIGIATAAAGIAGSAMSSSASKSAAQQQADAAQKGLDFQQKIWDQTQQNQAPFLQAGQQGVGDLMKGFQDGTFGQSNPAPQYTGGAAPQYTGAGFKAPTLEEAQATPGYQFALQQGNKGILQGSAAMGGAISGGTLKNMSGYDVNLANSTYTDDFNRALSTYNTGLSDYSAKLQGYDAGLQGYNSQLAGYGAGLSGQQQQFNEMLAPAQIGEGAVQNLANVGQNVSSNVGNLMTQQGNAQAAGTVGSANAWNSGISGATGGLLQSILMGSLLKGSSGSLSMDPNGLSGLSSAALAGMGLGPS